MAASPWEGPELTAAPDDAVRLGDSLGLIQLSHLVQAAFTRVAERHDLTPAQGRLLCVLAQSPRGMAELARGFGVERAALTGLIDRAERRGLVQRCAVPGDRRAVNVMLTPRGHQTAARFHAESTAELDLLLTPLTSRQRSAFRAALAAITQSAANSAG
jgi:DNA-binding MarR family transcriptional regulator